MQVRSTTRRVRRSRVEQEKFIMQLKSGLHAGKYQVKAPNGRDEAGRQQYKRFGPYASLEQAIAERDKHLARQKEQPSQALPLGRQPKAMTLRDWSAHWLDAIVRIEASASTLDNYTRSVERHILPSLGRIPLVELSQTRIEKWRNELAGETGAAAVNYALKRLKTALETACGRPETGLKDNPARHVKTLDEDKGAEYVGSPSDLPKLVAAIGDSYLAALPQVATDAGLRRSETAGLHWADVDFEGRRLVLRWHLVSSGGITAFRPGTKASDGEFESVHLSQRSLDALKAARERLLAHKLGTRRWKAGAVDGVFYAANQKARSGRPFVVPQNPVADEALVFPTADGTPFATNSMGEWFRRMTAKAGITKTLHGLRHDCGSFLLAAGVPLTVVSKHLRHANTAITAQIYAHQLKEQERLGADTFDQLWAALDSQAQAV